VTTTSWSPVISKASPADNGSARLERVRPPGSISTISAHVAATALRSPAYALDNVRLLSAEREWLATGLRCTLTVPLRERLEHGAFNGSGTFSQLLFAANGQGAQLFVDQVPEPSSILAVLGAAGMLMARRRHTSRAPH